MPNNQPQTPSKSIKIYPDFTTTKNPISPLLLGKVNTFYATKLTPALQDLQTFVNLDLPNKIQAIMHALSFDVQENFENLTILDIMDADLGGPANEWLTFQMRVQVTNRPELVFTIDVVIDKSKVDAYEKTVAALHRVEFNPAFRAVFFETPANFRLLDGKKHFNVRDDVAFLQFVDTATINELIREDIELSFDFWYIKTEETFVCKFILRKFFPHPDETISVQRHVEAMVTRSQMASIKEDKYYNLYNQIWNAPTAIFANYGHGVALDNITRLEFEALKGAEDQPKTLAWLHERTNYPTIVTSPHLVPQIITWAGEPTAKTATLTIKYELTLEPQVVWQVVEKTFTLNFNAILNETLVGDDDVDLEQSVKRGHTLLEKPTLAQARNWLVFSPNLVKYYDFADVVSWEPVLVDKTVGTAKEVVVVLEFALKNQKKTKQIRVTLQFDYSYHDYVHEALHKSLGDRGPTNPFVPFVFAYDPGNYSQDASAMEQFWRSLPKHPTFLDNGGIQDDVRYFVSQVRELDPAEQNALLVVQDNQLERGYMFSLTAEALNAKKAPIIGAIAVVDVPVIFKLNPDSANYIKIRLKDSDIAFTEQLRVADYRYLSDLSSYQIKNYIDDGRLVKDLVITKARVEIPAAGENFIHVFVHFHYLKTNGEIGSYAHIERYQVTVSNTYDHLELDTFITDLQIPSTQILHVPRLVAFDVTPWENNRSFTEFLATNVFYKSAAQQPFDLQKRIEAFNPTTQYQPIKIVEFKYAYDAREITNLTAHLTIALQKGRAYKELHIALRFAQSFGQNVKYRLVDSVDIKIDPRFTKITSSTPVTQYSIGPTLQDFIFQVDEAKVTKRTLEFTIQSYAYSQPDIASASAVVRASFTKNKLVYRDFVVAWNYSAAKNHVLTSRLPSDLEISIADLNNLTKYHLDAVTYTPAEIKKILVGTPFAQTSVVVTNITVQSLPNAAQEKMHEKVVFDAAYGAAKPKRVTLVRNISVRSQLAFSIFLGMNTQGNHVTLKANAHLVNEFETVRKIMRSDQGFHTPRSLTRYVDVVNNKTHRNLNAEKWLAYLDKKDIYFTFGNLIPPRDPSSKTATLRLTFRMRKSPVVIVKSLPFVFTRCYDELLMANITEKAFDIKVDEGFEVVGQSIRTLRTNLAFDPRSYLLTFPARITFSNYKLHPLKLVKHDGEFAVHQPLEFSFTAGQQKSKTYHINFVLGKRSKLYVEFILDKLVDLTLNYQFHTTKDFLLHNFANNIEFLQCAAKTKEFPVKTLEDCLLTSLITQVAITKLPNFNDQMGIFSVVFELPSGIVTREFKFQTNISPNAAALNQAVQFDSGQLSINLFEKAPNGDLLVSAKDTLQGAISAPIPTASDLGLSASQGKDIAKFLEWMRTHTNYHFNFLTATQRNLSLFQVPKVSDVEFIRHEDTPRQFLKVKLTSGKQEKTIFLALQFGQSPMDRRREQFVRNLTIKEFLRPEYFDIQQMREPRVGRFSVHANVNILDVFRARHSDFRVRELVAQKIVVDRVERFVPPEPDSKRASVTLRVIDWEKKAAPQRYYLDFAFDFTRTANQIKTDWLTALKNPALQKYTGANGQDYPAIVYEFETFWPEGLRTKLPMENFPWPEEVPHVTSVENVSEARTTIGQVHKVAVAFGAAQPRTIYLVGRLKKQTKLYLQNLLRNVRVKLPSQLVDSPTFRPRSYALKNYEILECGLVLTHPQKTGDFGDVIRSRQSQLRFGNALITGVQILQFELADGDSREANVVLSAAYYDEASGVNNLIVAERADTFRYRYTTNEAILNAFIERANALSTPIVLGRAGTPITSANSIAAAASPVLGKTLRRADQVRWLYNQTNLAEYEGLWKKPAGAMITNVTYDFDKTTTNQVVRVSYQIGKAVTPPLALTLRYDKSANQLYLESLSQAKLVTFKRDYTHFRYTRRPAAPTVNDIVLGARILLHGTDPIFDFVPPKPDETVGSVKLRVMLADDERATQIAKVNINYVTSLHQTLRDEVMAKLYFVLNPYVEGLPTEQEMRNADPVFDLASNLLHPKQVDILKLDEYDPDHEGDLRRKIEDERARYLVEVHFGTFKANVVFIRAIQPFKRPFERAMADVTFQIRSGILELEPNKVTELRATDLVIRKAGEVTSALPNLVSYDSSSFVYHGPEDPDSVYATIDFYLVYTDYIYKWTNGTEIERGAHDFNSLPNRGTYYQVVNSEDTDIEMLRKVVHFKFEHSQHYYDLQQQIAKFTDKKFGAPGQTKTVPITDPLCPPREFPTSRGQDLVKTKLAYLKRITNFDDAQLVSAGITISDLTYLVTPNTATPTVRIQVRKGQTYAMFDIELVFAQSINQHEIHQLGVDELVLRVSNYADNATTLPPIARDFDLRPGYELVEIRNYHAPNSVDTTAAQVDLVIRRQDDPTAMRIITYNFSFRYSLNVVTLNQLRFLCDVNPNLQITNFDHALVSNFDDLVVQSGEWDPRIAEIFKVVTILQTQPLDYEEVVQINPAWVRAWNVRIALGAAKRVICFGQREGLVFAEYKAIIHGLEMHLDDALRTDQLHHRVPRANDLTFTKAGDKYILPDDVSTTGGKFEIHINKVDMPASDDGHEALIHYETRFATLDDNRILRNYVVKNQTLPFTYYYTRNELTIFKMLHETFFKFAPRQGGRFYQVTGVGNRIVDQIAPARFSDRASSAFINYLTYHTPINLTDELKNNKIKLKLNYARGGVRDDSSINQLVTLQFTRGKSMLTLETEMVFAKSANQNALDHTHIKDVVVGLDPGYLQTTKSSPPTVNQILVKSRFYKVKRIISESYQVPTVDYEDKKYSCASKFDVEVEHVFDARTHRNFTYNFTFATVSANVGNLINAKFGYTSEGVTITNLPNHQKLTLGHTAINGYTKPKLIHLERVDKNSNITKITLPRTLTFEYRVTKNANTDYQRVVYNWTKRVPTNLENDDIFEARIVPLSADKYTVIKQNVFKSPLVGGLRLPIALPANFEIPEPEFFGFNGAGTLAARTLPHHYVNVGLRTQAREQGHLSTHFDITAKYHRLHGQLVFANARAETIQNLEMEQHVYATIHATRNYFLTTSLPLQYLGEVTGLSIVPTVALQEIKIITTTLDGRQSQNGAATPRIVPVNTKRDIFDVHPQEHDMWEWNYQVMDASGQVRLEKSTTAPTDLVNGDVVRVNYEPRTGYKLKTDFDGKTLKVSGLYYPVVIPSDVQFSPLVTFGHSRHGKILPPKKGGTWFTSSLFEHQKNVDVHFKVVRQDGTLKYDYTPYNTINTLEVTDHIFAKYVVDNPYDYVILNGEEDIEVGVVTNLQVTPRVLPSELQISFVGSNGHADIKIADATGDTNNVLPEFGQDYWHWEYQVSARSSGGQEVLVPWQSHVPVKLTNNSVVHIRVVADSAFILDGTYAERVVRVQNLKEELDMSDFVEPTLVFDGYLGAGHVVQILGKDGQDYVLPTNTLWEYYLAPIGETPTESTIKMQNDHNWHDWLDRVTYKDLDTLTVGQGIYMRLTTDANRYVLSQKVVTKRLEVTKLKINTSQIEPHFTIEGDDRAGFIRVAYAKFSGHVAKNHNPLLLNENQLNVTWMVQINNGKFTKIDGIKNLKNGDQLVLKSVPISEAYIIAPSEVLTFRLTVRDLTTKIDTRALRITRYNHFFHQDEPREIFIGKASQAIQNGKAGLLRAQVIRSAEVVRNLPAHLHVYYKHLPATDDRKFFTEVEPAFLPPQRGLSNHDRIRIYLDSDHPQFTVSDSQAVEFVINTLGPEIPRFLTAHFAYSRNQVSGAATGEVLPSFANPNSVTASFFWQYVVVPYTNDIPYTPSTFASVKLPKEVRWSNKPPTKLRNGDVVYFRLHSKIPDFNFVGYFEDPETFELKRNDYLSEPILITGLRMPNPTKMLGKKSS